VKTVTIQQAKMNFLKLIEDVCHGEEIVIVRGIKPVAKLVPFSSYPKKRKPGWSKGNPPPRLR
jgi:prevent-host-death family protein